MTSETVYLGLGSNLGDSVRTVGQALEAIGGISGVRFLESSRLYATSPISPIPQADYINAVCRLQTTLDPEGLFSELCRIEQQLGKHPKDKNAPREIDIDILFFGTRFCRSELLEIPHPRWKQRLFVLAPLQELTQTITYPIDNQGTVEIVSLEELISGLGDLHNQRVFALTTSFCNHHLSSLFQVAANCPLRPS
jgi:2-amino-4-hydroxy-6-hydroxymethyldihydropteridine diphosphokinase